MRAAFPWRWVALFAALKVGLHVATADNYGWHIDELYFVASSRHLDWGYVDYPPLVPLLARLDQAVFPGSLVALRALPALAGAAIVVLTALVAREMGGGARPGMGGADGVALTDVHRRQRPLPHHDVRRAGLGRGAAGLRPPAA